MKTRKNRRVILIMSIVLALITLLSSTFAWFTTQDNVTNHLETDSLTHGDAKIIEIFDEDEPMNPGTSVDKFAGVVNTGSTEAFVRISFAEAIQKLANNGVPTAVDSIFDGDDGIIPQLFDKAAITTGAYSTWKVLAKDDENFDGDSLTAFLAATTGIEVRYNKTTVNGGKTYYQFVAYAPLTGDYAKYNGKYQLVDIDIAVNKAGELSINQINIGTEASPTMVDIAYMQFTQEAQTTARWATLTGHTPFSTYTNKLNTPAITLDPGATPDPIYDTTSHVDPMIKLIFGTNVKTNLTACSKGDWWYNSDDGYFYYIGKLASGAQTANWLLEAVKLDVDAGNAYCNLNYDLTPCMDAVQAVEEAVSDAASWGLGGKSYYNYLIGLLTA